MFYSVKSEWMRTLDKNDRIPLHMDMQVPWSPWMDGNGLSLRQIKHNPQWGVMFYSVKSEWMRTLDKNDRIPSHMDMQVPWSPWMDENGLSLRQIKHKPQWGFYVLFGEIRMDENPR